MPRRGSASQSTIRITMMRRRSVVDDIADALRRFADMAPNPFAQMAKGITAQHLESARPRHSTLQPVYDAPRTRRHHDHLVGKIDRLSQTVSDENDRLAGRSPNPQQF